MEIGELKHPWVKHDHFVGLQVDYLNSWQRVQDIIQIVQLLGFAFFVETRKSQSDFTDEPVVLSGSTNSTRKQSAHRTCTARSG